MAVIVGVRNPRRLPTHAFMTYKAGPDSTGDPKESTTVVRTYLDRCNFVCFAGINAIKSSSKPLAPPRHQTATGAKIVIEERPASELKALAGTKIAPDGIAAWNPAFDVTPAGLITAIVTDKGPVPRKGEGKKAFDVKSFCESNAAGEVRTGRR